ncbi:MAG: hypothetical protein JRN08_08035 [Nitrososphaerota archaeon]|nr:hypothetical protein [Nitrososphaerota archaeon]
MVRLPSVFLEEPASPFADFATTRLNQAPPSPNIPRVAGTVKKVRTQTEQRKSTASPRTLVYGVRTGLKPRSGARDAMAETRAATPT